MFSRLVTARIAPHFVPVGLAPPARQRRHGFEQRERISEKIVLPSNQPDEPRFQGMMR
jgi:hypothetical protein